MSVSEPDAAEAASGFLVVQPRREKITYPAAEERRDRNENSFDGRR